MRLPRLAILLPVLLATPAIAETYAFEAGDDWSKIGPRLVAGDIVVLLEGTHVPAQFENLSGAPGNPIVIRPAEKVKFAEIAGKREGLRLTNCRHVRLERLHVKGARRAGIVVDSIGDARSSDIAIHDSVISGVGGLVEQSGILVISTDGLDIRRTRIENCDGAGARFENSSAITCEQVEIRTVDAARTTTGMLFLGEIAKVEVNDAVISGRFETGLSLGARDAPRAPREVRDLVPLKPSPVGNDAPSAPAETVPTQTAPAQTSPAQTSPADLVRPKSPEPGKDARFSDGTFTNVLLSGCERALELGSTARVLVSASTIVDPIEEVIRVVRPGDGRPGPSMQFRENIVVWQPRGLRRFVDMPEGIAAEGLIFGSNLWWSKELPDALPLLGPSENPFFGTLDTPQTTTLDPKLDQRGRPTREEAKLFGRNL